MPALTSTLPLEVEPPKGLSLECFTETLNTALPILAEQAQDSMRKRIDSALLMIATHCKLLTC